MLLLFVSLVAGSELGYENNGDGDNLRIYLSIIRSELTDAEAKLYPEYAADDLWIHGDDWLWVGNPVLKNVIAISEYSRLAAELFDDDADVISEHELRLVISNIESEIMEAKKKLYPEYTPYDYGWVWNGYSVWSNVNAIFEYSRLAKELHDIDYADDESTLIAEE